MPNDDRMKTLARECVVKCLKGVPGCGAPPYESILAALRAAVQWERTRIIRELKDKPDAQ